jgi:hypothetical protein
VYRVGRADHRPEAFAALRRGPIQAPSITENLTHLGYQTAAKAITAVMRNVRGSLMIFSPLRQRHQGVPRPVVFGGSDACGCPGPDSAAATTGCASPATACQQHQPAATAAAGVHQPGHWV